MILLQGYLLMSRKFVLVVSFGFLILLCGMTMSCGSSGSGGGNKVPFNVVGNWQANFTANVGATATGYGAIDSSGLGAFLDTSGNIVQLPTITGVNSFSGNLTAYAVNPTVFPDGSVVVTDAAQGNVNSATSITGTFTGTGSPSGSFSAVPDSPLGGSAVVVSGVMNGKIMGFVDTLQLTLSGNGSFTGGDFGPGGAVCNVTGTLTQQGTNDVFDVTYNTPSGDCRLDTQTGIAFESKTDYLSVNGGKNATYLYLILLTSVAQARPAVYVVYQ